MGKVATLSKSCDINNACVLTDRARFEAAIKDRHRAIRIEAGSCLLEFLCPRRFDVCVCIGMYCSVSVVCVDVILIPVP